MNHEAVMVAGWGQVTQPKESSPPYLEPLDLMVDATRQAASQAGRDALRKVDALFVVRPQSRDLRDAPAQLARRLGITPKVTRLSGIGGQVPQQLVNQAAGMLARGEVESVLVCGAETYYPRAADSVRGELGLLQGIPADYAADDATGSNALEQRHGLTLPIHGFPLFENALWAESGLDRAQWLAKVGALWSSFSEIAARHPNAWTRKPLSAADIVTPGPDNRPICYPYTKRMVSLVMADLGAAVLLTRAGQAASSRDGGGTPVYFLGGAFARDRQRFPIERSSFTRSSAMAQAFARTWQRTGLGPDDVEGFDLYSCFPCAVTLARRELGLAETDPRPLTRTGGLGFFGGPGSNYALHGIATVAEEIGRGVLGTGMATALGWFVHKYAVGVYGKFPGSTDLRQFAHEDETNPDAGPAPEHFADAGEGEGTVETWTVLHDRDQQPTQALIYGRQVNGLRFVANGAPDEVPAWTGENRVGQRLRLECRNGLTLARLA